MSLLLKSSLLGVGFATTGAGFVGSNYLFQKDKYVDLKQENNNAEWDKKLDILIARLSQDGLSNKINSATGNTSNLLVNNENEHSIKTFTNKDSARSDLIKWCKKDNKDELEKKHENDLCKETKRVNWLFE